MSRRCPHCDQRLMPDEQICWNCGQPIDAAPHDAVEADSAVSGSDRADLSMVVYGGTTLAVLLAAFFLTLYLGRQPRFEASAAELPDGWLIARNEEQTFAIFLPQTWDLHQNPEEEGTLPDNLTGADLYHDALLPLAGFVDDEEALFLAIGSEPSTFLLVARSAILNRLSPADVAQADYSQSNAEGVIVLEARRLESLGTAQAHLQVQHSAGVCRQRFMRGEQNALLFALCAMPGALADESAETILSSIQLLRQ